MEADAPEGRLVDSSEAHSLSDQPVSFNKKTKHWRDDSIEFRMMPMGMNKIAYQLLCLIMIGGALRAAPAVPVAPPVAEAPLRDILVYADGDRVLGRLVERTQFLIVFRSDRFGEIRVPADQVVVLQPDRLAAVAPEVRLTQSDDERFSPARLTAQLRSFFGPWHGKFAFSSEVVTDTQQSSNLASEIQFKRVWRVDEVHFKGRYDFNQATNLTTTDMLRLEALWRHDFTKGRFALYRPSAEWNRASFNMTLPNDYLLLQQEVGVGLNLFTTERRKVRIGASENLFDVWNTSVANTPHSSRTLESAFLETEWGLPWRMSFNQRSVYYYSLSSATDGWENHVELSKKFTETLSTSIRQEMRRNNPDGTLQDYKRLKLLFALDF